MKQKISEFVEVGKLTDSNDERMSEVISRGLAIACFLHSAGDRTAQALFTVEGLPCWLYLDEITGKAIIWAFDAEEKAVNDGILQGFKKEGAWIFSDELLDSTGAPCLGFYRLTGHELQEIEQEHAPLVDVTVYGMPGEYTGDIKAIALGAFPFLRRLDAYGYRTGLPVMQPANFQKGGFMFKLWQGHDDGIKVARHTLEEYERISFPEKGHALGVFL